MSESTARPRIIPSVDQSMTAKHLRYPKGPKVWPLWLMIIVLWGVLALAVAALWYERERLIGDIQRMTNENSNLHARFDSGDTDTQDTLTFIQAQLATLYQEQEQLAVTVGNAREELYQLVTTNGEMASSDALESLTQATEQLKEQAALRDGRLGAIQVSLAALEQTGASSRQRLAEEIEALEQSAEQRFATINQQVASGTNDLSSQLATWQNETDQRLNRLASDIDALSLEEPMLSEEAFDTWEQQWSQRLNTLESDVRQLRQAQLAFSAQMEMLR